MNSGKDLVGVPELAFPDDPHAPAQTAEAPDVLLVVRDVPRELLRPELPVALGGGGLLAPLVPVPEATVDEDHGLVFRQNEVRLAGEVRSVEPETVPRAVQQATNLPLRAGVLAPDL